MKYVIYSRHGHEAAVFGTLVNARSAVDGKHRPDPDLGGMNASTPLADSFFSDYSDMDEDFNPVILPFADLVNDVTEFHVKFDLPASTTARVMPQEMSDFRIKFMEEELAEYKEAGANIGRVLHDHDLNEVLSQGQADEVAKSLQDQLDALVDLAYVTVGCAYLQFGPAKFAEAWSRVHKANMSKERAQTAEQSKRGSSLDVIKPEGWEAPDHSDLVWPFVIGGE